MIDEQISKLFTTAQIEDHKNRLREQISKLKSQAHAGEQQCSMRAAHLAHVWPSEDIIHFCPGLWSHAMVLDRYFECEGRGWTGEFNYHDWRREAQKRVLLHI